MVGSIWRHKPLRYSTLYFLLATVLAFVLMAVTVLVARDQAPDWRLNWVFYMIFDSILLVVLGLIPAVLLFGALSLPRKIGFLFFAVPMFLVAFVSQMFVIEVMVGFTYLQVNGS
jgi:hypothetical protein